MNRVQVIEQIVSALEPAGFRHQEIIVQLESLPFPFPDRLEVTCYREWAEAKLKVTGWLNTTEDTDTVGYQLQTLTVYDPLIPSWEKQPLAFRHEDNDPMEIPFAVYLHGGGFERLYTELFISEFTLLDRRSSDSIIRSALLRLPYETRVEGHSSDVSGITDYTFTLERIPKEYRIRDYELTFTPIPAVHHGTFNGIDTRKLEYAMAAVNWDTERGILCKDLSVPEFTDQVQRILIQLEALSKSNPGRDIGHLLQLKYMQRRSVAEVLIQDEAWQALTRLPHIRAIFPPEVSLRSAINLMAGRAVINIADHGHRSEATVWHKMTGIAKDLSPTIQQIKSFPWTMLAEQVRRVVPNEGKAMHTTYLLSRGDIVRIKTSDQILFLRAAPELRSIQILTPDMRTVPFNHHLNPDWRPEQNPSERRQNLHQKGRNAKRKGKGI